MVLGAQRLVFVSAAVALSACGPACTPPPADAPAAGAPAAENPPADPAQKPADGGAEAKPATPLPTGGAMISNLPGVDTRKLSEAQRTQFLQIVNTEPSACGKPHSLAHSVTKDASCRDSLLLAQYIADRIGGGASPSDVKRELEFVAGTLKPKTINYKGRPSWGDENAPVTVAVFADFECPHCRAEAPKIRKIVGEQFAGRARIVFKHFPLGGHPRAKEAAIACEAAHEQGKFWEMHDIVFANQMALSDEDIEKYARQIGLDMGAFRTSFDAKRGKAAVEADRAEGDKLQIQGKPAVFVNGRYVNELLFGGDLALWIDDALKR